MQERATHEQVERVVAQLIDMGFDVHRSSGALRTVIGAVGGKVGDPRLIEVLEGQVADPFTVWVLADDHVVLLVSHGGSLPDRGRA